jgi:hypothetical protein
LIAILDVSAINPLVAFFDIHVGKAETIFLYFVPDTTQDIIIIISLLMSSLLEQLLMNYTEEERAKNHHAGPDW